jgi:hypothetical protein
VFLGVGNLTGLGSNFLLQIHAILEIFLTTQYTILSQYSRYFGQILQSLINNPGEERVVRVRVKKIAGEVLKIKK